MWLLVTGYDENGEPVVHRIEGDGVCWEGDGLRIRDQNDPVIVTFPEEFGNGPVQLVNIRGQLPPTPVIAGTPLPLDPVNIRGPLPLDVVDGSKALFLDPVNIKGPLPELPLGGSKTQHTLTVSTEGSVAITQSESSAKSLSSNKQPSSSEPHLVKNPVSTSLRNSALWVITDPDELVIEPKETKDTQVSVATKDTQASVEAKDTPVSVEIKDTQVSVETKDTQVSIDLVTPATSEKEAEFVCASSESNKETLPTAGEEAKTKDTEELTESPVDQSSLDFGVLPTPGSCGQSGPLRRSSSLKYSNSPRRVSLRGSVRFKENPVTIPVPVVSYSTTFPRRIYAKPTMSDAETDELENGAKVADDSRSKSSADVRDAESPSGDKRKSGGIWGTFKKSARRLRSRSREKARKSRLSSSQPDLSDGGSPTGNPDDENPFERRNDESMTNGVNSEGDSGIAVVDQSEASALHNKESVFRSHPFFELACVLKSGRDLVVRDSCGTSDPYVKFKIGNKQLYKSRTVFKNLNPNWDEKFSLPIEDPFKPISVRVLDYDKGLNDDSMGGAELLPTTLDIQKPQDVKLMLSEKTGKDKNNYMGYIILNVTLLPKTQDEKEQYFKKGGGKVGEQAKKLKTQIWSGVITVVLVEGSQLLPMDDNGFSDPYVKFRLGNEKYKSKHKNKTLNPRWLEQFDLHIYDMQTSQLEVSVWDHDTAGKDDIMGRALIDLVELKREVTHDINQPLEDGAGFIRMLITITGTAGGESISDLGNYTADPREREDIVRKYGLVNSVKNLRDVGWLQVKVVKAQGLAAADIGGKSDPYCVLELVNSRLQTQTEYKTLSPEWGKVFTFQVGDIHSILEVTVYDEDRDKKAEFLGKVAIPLLRIRRHDRRWYQLKDKKVMGRGRGAILLEMDMVINHFKAAIRTFNPREEKFMQAEPKFKIPVMKRNIDRVSKIGEAAMEGGIFIQSCFDWESKARSITAFIVFLVIVWNFELYMLPITLLIVFFKNLLVVHIVGNLMKEKEDDEYVDEEEEDDDDDKDKQKDSKKEEKKSFKEKLQQIQEVCLQVQEGMDMVASGGERVKNTFNWTVPWLSWLAIIVLSIGTIVLYLVPLRYLILAWGINKFTKKLRAPNAIPNNELLDYLSRVPSDKELIQYRELRPDPGIGSQKKKRA